MILALETAGNTCSACIIDGNKILCEIYAHSGLKHSENLMPMVDDAINYAHIDKNELKFIALSIGPGSFTGLRIGAAVAKGLAMALNLPIIPIKTLDALAYNIHLPDTLTAPIMDARRGQVYASIFLDGKKIENDLAIEFEIFIKNLHRFNKKVLFLGDATSIYKDIILENGFLIANESLLFQRASAVAALASKNIDLAVPVDRLEIEYIRESSAQKLKNE